MVVHGCNLTTQEAEAGGLQEVLGQPGLHSEFKNALKDTVRLYLKTITDKKNKTMHTLRLIKENKV